jgi:hypothetical protein
MTTKEKPGLSMAQVAHKLTNATNATLNGQRPRDQMRTVLNEAFAEEPLASYIAALVGAIDGYRGSAALLMASAESVLIDASMTERASVLAGIANVAHNVGDLATEIATRQEAIAAQRHATREGLINLSSMLYSQAMLYDQLGDHSATLTLLEEVVTLDSQTEHPERDVHREVFEEARKKQVTTLQSPVHDAVMNWRQGACEKEELVSLLNMITSEATVILDDDSTEDREALAQDIALLRAACPLPIKGANEFLHILQLWLRNEPGMAEHAEKIRSSLPEEFVQKLARIRH